MAETEATLYQVADAEIRSCIEVYLELMRVTKGLSDVKPKHLKQEHLFTVKSTYGYLSP